MAEKRAVRDFQVGQDPWPVIQAWASEKGYKPVEQADGRALFKKGTGFLVAPRNLAVTAEGQSVHLEAWVSAGFFVRLMSLFILPAEITIESGGAKAIIPRKMARGDVNQLLERLGQPPLA